jgi:hypothetical protein
MHLIFTTFPPIVLNFNALELKIIGGKVVNIGLENRTRKDTFTHAILGCKIALRFCTLNLLLHVCFSPT